MQYNKYLPYKKQSHDCLNEKNSVGGAYMRK